MPELFTEKFASRFAAEWIAEWIARDLNRILKHYAQDIEFTSPFVSRLFQNGQTTLRGISRLGIYFSGALNAYPDLCFIPRGIYSGAQSLLIEYESVANLLAAEMMEFNDASLVCRVGVHYTAINPVSEIVPIRFVR